MLIIQSHHQHLERALLALEARGKQSFVVLTLLPAFALRCAFLQTKMPLSKITFQAQSLRKQLATTKSSNKFLIQLPSVSWNNKDVEACISVRKLKSPPWGHSSPTWESTFLKDIRLAYVMSAMARTLWLTTIISR